VQPGFSSKHHLCLRRAVNKVRRQGYVKSLGMDHSELAMLFRKRQQAALKAVEGLGTNP
jgi:hypothetical protein